MVPAILPSMNSNRSPKQADGDYLAPGTRYATIDEAMHAASCLCHMHPKGATIYGTTDPAHVFKESEEAYIVAIAITRKDGRRWSVPAGPYEPVYTIIRRQP